MKSSVKWAVSCEEIQILKNIVQSNCDTFRFGVEFCEFKLPTLKDVKIAYDLVKSEGKEFVYITPRVSECQIDILKEQFQYINNQQYPTRIIFNDWGVMKMISSFPNLIPQMGRQLISLPLRCNPSILDMFKKHGKIGLFIAGKIFERPNIIYKPTLEFLKKQSVCGFDIDWIPQTANSLKNVHRKGFQIAYHLNMIIAGITRNCHTARLMREKIPQKCSRPCYNRAFLLKNNKLKDMKLHGNALFTTVDIDKKSIKKVCVGKETELIFTANKLTKIENSNDINCSIKKYIN